MVGLLTEAASCRLASPLFLAKSDLSAPDGLKEYAASNRFPAPWPGGWWRLRALLDYEHAFARSRLGSLAREPRLWLENALGAAERAVERGREGAPRAWLIPSDNPDTAAVRRLVDALLLSGVEVSAAERDFAADGRRWPTGSLLVFADQPYGTHARDLFEVQEYPDGDPPYDVAGWTLPFLLGVRRVELMEAPEVPARRVATPEEALAGFGAARLDDPRNGDAWRRFVHTLENGGRAQLVEGRFRFGQDTDSTAAVGLPRIGIYAPWEGSLDEGWLRYAFDLFEIPYVTVRNEMLRAGGIADFLDVLVLPSLSPQDLDQGRAPGSVPERFAGGLDPEGAVAVEAFVRGGGRLLCQDGSAAWAIELFGLPLEDVAHGPDAGGFACPGSVLRAIPETHALTAGLPDSLALFFAGSSAWKVAEEKEPEGEVAHPDARRLDVLLRYAPTRVLLSGWIRAPEVIAERAAWVRAEHGSGAIHLFGFRPQYRGWSEEAMKLLFRAALLDR
jgi:hypothetical protein